MLVRIRSNVGVIKIKLEGELFSDLIYAIQDKGLKAEHQQYSLDRADTADILRLSTHGSVNLPSLGLTRDGCMIYLRNEIVKNRQDKHTTIDDNGDIIPFREYSFVGSIDEDDASNDDQQVGEGNVHTKQEETKKKRVYNEIITNDRNTTHINDTNDTNSELVRSVSPITSPTKRPSEHFNPSNIEIPPDDSVRRPDEVYQDRLLPSLDPYDIPYMPKNVADPDLASALMMDRWEQYRQPLRDIVPPRSEPTYLDDDNLGFQGDDLDPGVVDELMEQMKLRELIKDKSVDNKDNNTLPPVDLNPTLTTTTSIDLSGFTEEEVRKMIQLEKEFEMQKRKEAEEKRKRNDFVFDPKLMSAKELQENIDLELEFERKKKARERKKRREEKKKKISTGPPTLNRNSSFDTSQYSTSEIKRMIALERQFSREKKKKKLEEERRQRLKKRGDESLKKIRARADRIIRNSSTSGQSTKTRSVPAPTSTIRRRSSDRALKRTTLGSSNPSQTTSNRRTKNNERSIQIIGRSSTNPRLSTTNSSEKKISRRKSAEKKKKISRRRSADQKKKISKQTTSADKKNISRRMRSAEKKKKLARQASGEKKNKITGTRSIEKKKKSPKIRNSNDIERSTVNTTSNTTSNNNYIDENDPILQRIILQSISDK